jgi:AraC family transcriptional regulator
LTFYCPNKAHIDGSLTAIDYISGLINNLHKFANFQVLFIERLPDPLFSRAESTICWMFGKRWANTHQKMSNDRPYQSNVALFGADIAPDSLLDYTLAHRPEVLVEARSLGALEMLELSQNAGSYPDPPCDAFSLQLCLSGRLDGEIEFGGDRIHAGQFAAGDMCVSPPLTNAGYTMMGHHRILSVQIPFDLMYAVGSDLLPGFAGSLSHLHSQMFRAETISAQMMKIWRAAAGDAKAPSLDPHAEAISLVENLVRLSADPSAIKNKRVHLTRHVRDRVLDFINSNLADDVSLPTLANIADLSEYHFLRAFKAEIGETPHQYVLQQRVYRAEDLLRRTQRHASQIAVDCGFASHQHMCTAFSRIRGRTPSDSRLPLKQRMASPALAR